MFSLDKYLSSIDFSTWTLPNLFKIKSQYSFNSFLLFRNKHMFTVYGSPNFYWNGGRLGELNLTNDFLSNSIHQFNSIHVGCFTTFSNYFITQEHLKSPIGNFLLEVLSQESNNGVIISSDTLWKYIKHYYPNLILKCSILKSTYENYFHNIDWYKRMLDIFDIVVLHPDLPISIMEKLPEKERIEILVNEKCRKNCPNRRVCYLPYEDCSHKQSCGCNQDGKSTYTIDQIKLLYDMGFRKFKIQGR